MDNELTPVEQKFFETGELPPELAGLASGTGTPPAAPPATSTGVPPAAASPSPPAASPPPVTVTPPAPDDSDAMRQLRATTQAMTQRLAELTEKLEKANQPPPPQAPDPAVDPLGALMHEIKTMNGKMAEMEQRMTQGQQMTAQQQQFQAFVENIKAVKAEFIKTTPDFNAAYAHLRNTRMQDLRDVGVPEDQIPQVLLQDELAVAQNAIATGKNPAAVIYGMAKRYGYQGAAPAPAAGQTKLADLKQGLAASTNVPPATPDPALTVESLKDAGDADLDKIVQDDKQWARVVGNRSNSIF
jgi:hypothetical protein